MHEKFTKGGPVPNSIGALYSEVRELRLAMEKAVNEVKDRVLSMSETAQGYSCVANFKTSEILSLIEGLDADLALRLTRRRKS